MGLRFTVNQGTSRSEHDGTYPAQLFGDHGNLYGAGHKLRARRGTASRSNEGRKLGRT
jgi:hypothetical protein